MSEEKREKFKIELEPEEFKAIGAFKIATSAELGSLANEIFKTVFADYEGIIFDGNAGEPTYSLIFNHGKYEDDERVGVKSALEISRKDTNDAIARVRTMDNIYRNAAKYIATDDLKDVVEKLLVAPLYNKGNPKWGQIVTDYAERAPYNIYNPNQMNTYTKINGISANRLASLIFGYKDNEGDTFDYEVRVIGGANAGFGGKPTNWILQISRASYNEVNELYKSFGYNTTTSNIIR